MRFPKTDIIQVLADSYSSRLGSGRNHGVVFETGSIPNRNARCQYGLDDGGGWDGTLFANRMVKDYRLVVTAFHPSGNIGFCLFCDAQ
jgi:hypothetical protein